MKEPTLLCCGESVPIAAKILFAAPSIKRSESVFFPTGEFGTCALRVRYESVTLMDTDGSCLHCSAMMVRDGTDA